MTEEKLNVAPPDTSRRGDICLYQGNATNSSTVGIQYGSSTIKYNYGSSSSPSEDAYKKFINVLPSGNPSIYLEKIRREKPRTPDTCEWLQQRREFENWFNGDEHVLWIVGGPGTGKTVLSAYTVDYLERRLEKPQRPKLGTLAYYFCDTQDSSRNTADSVIGGLLRQLLQGQEELFNELKCEVMNNGLLRDTDALWGFFRAVLKLLMKDFAHVYLLIDGLDECEHPSSVGFINRLHCDLKENRIPMGTKFLITSQDVPWIVDKLGEEMKTLKIEPAMIAADVEKAIKKKISNLKFGYKKQKKLEDALIKKAEGRFLWADLAIEDLAKTQLTDLDVDKVVDMIPTTLEEAYDRTIEKIWCHRTDEAEFVLQFVTVARRPLTACEIDMAYAIWKNRDGRNSIPDLGDLRTNVYKSCTPLVVFDPDTQTVSLLHQTAKIYLLSNRPYVYLEMLHYLGIVVILLAGMTNPYFVILCLVTVGFYLYASPKRALRSPAALISALSNILNPPTFMTQHRVDLTKANFLALDVCQRYLGKQEFDRGQKIIKYERDHTLVPVFKDIPPEQPTCLVGYAAEHWREHALAMDSAHAVIHLRKLRSLPSLATLRDSLFLRAAECGHDKLLRVLLKEMGARMTVEDPNGKSALHLAALGGHLAAVRLLIKYGADPHSRDHVGATALHWAARGGDMETFNYLLAKHQQKRYGRKSGDRHLLAEKNWSWVFHRESQNGETDLELPDNVGGTLLAWAIERGSEGVVKFLLAKSVKTDYTYFRDKRRAISNEGDMKIGISMDEFLERVIGIEIRQNQRQRTPLSRAAERGQEKFVEMLLEHGADPNFKDDLGRTAIFWAANHDHGTMIQSLRSKGAECESQLRFAISSKQVRNLINIGEADPNRKDEHGFSAVCWAAVGGKKFVMEELLQKANANFRIRETNITPLGLAALFGQNDVIASLINRNAKVDWVDNFNLTPLLLATYEGHNNVIASLIKIGKANVNSETKSGQTALDVAAMTGNEEGFTLLLREGTINLNHCDKMGRSVLFYAIMGGNRQIIDRLLSNRCVQRTILDFYHATALSIAARFGDNGTAEKLLSKDGAMQLTTRDKFGRSPIAWAALKGHSSTRNLLLAKCNELGLRAEGDGITPIIPPHVTTGSQFWWVFCDVCCFSIGEGEQYYNCKECLGGYYVCCHECWEKLCPQPSCLRSTHKTNLRTSDSKGKWEKSFGHKFRSTKHGQGKFISKVLETIYEAYVTV